MSSKTSGERSGGYSTLKRRIRIVLEDLKGEESVKTIFRGENIHTTSCCEWSKEFLEAGKRHIAGDMAREAASSEVGDLRKRNETLKQVLAELIRKNRILKECNGPGIRQESCMKYSQTEEFEINRMVEQSDLGVRAGS